MVNCPYGCLNRFFDTRSNTSIDELIPPLDLIAPAHEIQMMKPAMESAAQKSSFRRSFLLEHFRTEGSQQSSADSQQDMHVVVIRNSSPRRMTANQRALRELANLCSCRSSILWIACLLGILVFIVVHSEFSGENLEQGVKWLLNNVRRR
jgi:hypothetical protein